MELWIRSQDKEDLIKAYNFRILNQSNIAINVEVRGSSLDYLIVGKYATKERALEILDEIQNILNLKDMYKYDRELVLKSWENVDKEQVKIVRQQMSVYEMPKE